MIAQAVGKTAERQNAGVKVVAWFEEDQTLLEVVGDRSNLERSVSHRDAFVE